MTTTVSLVVEQGDHTALKQLADHWATDGKEGNTCMGMVRAEAVVFAKANAGLKSSPQNWVEAMNLFADHITDSADFDRLVKLGKEFGFASEASINRYVRDSRMLMIALLNGSKIKGYRKLIDKGVELLDTSGDDNGPVKGYSAGNARRGAEKRKAEKDKADAEAGIKRAKHTLNVTALLALKVKAEAIIVDPNTDTLALDLATDMVEFANSVLTPVNA